MLLGDLGASVIKVEGPSGDATRTWGPPWHGDASTYFHSINRNKRSIVLDLATAEDRALALRLAGRADVLVENLRPGAMARFGLGYDGVAEANAGLVYCSISGFGTQPGGADLPGYDLLVQAVGGLMSVTGEDGGRPVKVGVALVDVLCGLHGAIGVLAALRAREQTGRGQHVEVDLLTSILSALTNQAAGFLLAGVVPGPLGNGHPSLAPYESFEASDGTVVIAVGTDRQFASLCAGLARDDLAVDERFATNAARVANRPALRAALDTIFGGMTRAEIMDRLRPHGVPCGPVNDIAEAFAFAESIGLEPTWDVGGDRQVRAPLRLSATPARPQRPVPALGAQSDEIRAWLEADGA